MVKLTGAFSRIAKKKILVAGDLMLDSYTIGKARRISPEAPVAVIEVHKEEQRPGGAGNVMLNLISMGAEVACLGRIGPDDNGALLKEELEKEGIQTNGLVEEKGYRTPKKNRIIAEGQQIVRVDYEKNTPMPELLEQKIIEGLPEQLAGVDLIALSDYGKGFLTRTLISSLIDEAKKQDIPVLVDPKGIDFSRYAGAYLIKPNLGEAYAAAGLTPDFPLEQAAKKILEMCQSEILMVTRSENGIALYHRTGEEEHFPVRIHEVKDVTGAGDTVLATVAIAIASGLSVGQAAQLSNVAAGIAIERFGCARVTLSDIARRLLKYDLVNKVFDQEHLFALKEALKGQEFSLAVISGFTGISNHLYSSIRELCREQKEIIVYVDNSDVCKDFINILASLREVGFVIVDGNSLKEICNEIDPKEIHIIEEKTVRKINNLQCFKF